MAEIQRSRFFGSGLLVLSMAGSLLVIYLGWRLGLGLVRSTPGPQGTTNLVVLVLSLSITFLSYADMTRFAPAWNPWLLLATSCAIPIIALGVYLIPGVSSSFGLSLAMALISPLLVLMFLGGLRALLRPRERIVEERESANREYDEAVNEFEFVATFVGADVREHVPHEEPRLLVTLLLALRAAVLVAMIALGLAHYLSSYGRVDHLPSLQPIHAGLLGWAATAGIYFDLLILVPLNTRVIGGILVVAILTNAAFPSILPDQVGHPLIFLSAMLPALYLFWIGFRYLGYVAYLRQAMRYFYWVRRSRRRYGIYHGIGLLVTIRRRFVDKLKER